MYVDSEATHHLTADIANLAVHSEYQEPDRVRMDNGTGLPIRSTGASLLYSHISSFVLKNLLHVSDITKNFLSVSQFTADNKVLLEFHPDSCFIKDLSTRKTLLRGQLKDGMYVIYLGNHNFTVSLQALLDKRAYSSIWHERLGHPSTKVISSVLSQHRLSFFTDRAGILSASPVSKENVIVSFFRHLPRLLLLL